jgi:hypothetical protein
MNRSLITPLLLLFLIATPAYPLQPATSFLTRLPVLPGTGCPGDRKIFDDFTILINQVYDDLAQEIKEREDVLKDAKNRNTKQMQESLMDEPDFEGVTGDRLKNISRQQ